MWMACLAMDPNDLRILFTGSHRVWRTQNEGKLWKPVSRVLDGSAITAIEVARADRMRIYIGTSSGGLFRSVDGGDTWSENLATSVLPKFPLTRIKSSPRDADVVFLTVGSTGHSHVFRSLDGGLAWTDLDRERLPDAEHYSIAIPRDAPESIYVSHAAGLCFSPDRGENWQDLTLNLPNTRVVDILYHDKDGALYAATYGRGLFRIQVRH